MTDKGGIGRSRRRRRSANRYTSKSEISEKSCASGCLKIIVGLAAAASLTYAILPKIPKQTEVNPEKEQVIKP